MYVNTYIHVRTCTCTYKMEIVILCTHVSHITNQLQGFTVTFSYSLSVSLCLSFSLTLYNDFSYNSISYVSFLVTSPELDGHPLAGKFYIHTYIHTGTLTCTYMYMYNISPLNIMYILVHTCIVYMYMYM